MDPRPVAVSIVETGRAPSTLARPLPGLVPLLDPVGALLSAPTAYAHGIPWDVWVVRPDGSGLRRVTSFSDDDSSVAWPPDGRWLVTLSAEALHVVARFYGEAIARATARHMEYPFPDDNRRRV